MRTASTAMATFPRSMRKLGAEQECNAGEVEGVGDVVLRMAELPEADHGKGGEHERRGARGQTVEAVGEVHCVGGRFDHENSQHGHADLPEVDEEARVGACM